MSAPSASFAQIEEPLLSTAMMFALGCSVLMLEVSLTRVFSFTLWYHMTYLVVGLVMLGFGAAGTALAVRPRAEADDYRGVVAKCCALFSLWAVIATVVGVRLPGNTDQIFEGDYLQIPVMLLTHFLLATPFFYAGKAIGFVLMRNRKHTNSLYAFDLIGAGLGALLAVLLINRLGAVGAIFFGATPPALVAFAASSRARPAMRAALACLALALTAGTVASTRLDLVPLKVSSSKDLNGYQKNVTFSQWNILNRIDVLAPDSERFDFGGRISETYKGPFPLQRLIFQDGTAPTALVHIERDPQNEPFLGSLLQGAPYAIRNKPQQVLILGFGGGIDGLIAEHAGAAHITGVDINPITAALVSRRFRDFDPGLWRSQNVDLVVSEGRNYLTRTSNQYDVVQLSGVDTFAALSAGAFALSENYLYTSQAVDDLLNHLTDNGVLSYSRWLFTPPRETLRLAVTIREALRRAGIQDARTHIVIVAGGPPLSRWADTMVKKTPFTPDEVEALRIWARDRDFGLIYSPYHPMDNYFNRYLNGTDQEQKAFIANYMYDVSPSTDDNPFFFQFYRWKDIWHPDAVQGLGGYVFGRTPKGLLSLFVALIEMTALSFAFVLLPLRKREFGIRMRECAPWMAAFAGLGLGFIAIEMVLMQKLSVFVGGPAYSMTFTLLSLLVFSGVGSRLGQRIVMGPKQISGALLSIVAVQAVELAFLDHGVPKLLGLPQDWRCLVTVAAIAPLGILMGMPFPSLLAAAGEKYEALIPWAWGVNACASVVGTVLATISSMTFGFNWTWVMAMGAYAAVLAVTVQTGGGRVAEKRRGATPRESERDAEPEPSLVGSV